MRIHFDDNLERDRFSLAITKLSLAEEKLQRISAFCEGLDGTVGTQAGDEADEAEDLVRWCRHLLGSLWIRSR